MPKIQTNVESHHLLIFENLHTDFGWKLHGLLSQSIVRVQGPDFSGFIIRHSLVLRTIR